MVLEGCFSGWRLVAQDHTYINNFDGNVNGMINKFADDTINGGIVNSDGYDWIDQMGT